MTPRSPLSAIGVTEDAARLYELLLDEPGLSTTELARRIGSTEPRVRYSLKALTEKGLVETAALSRPRFFPTPPGIAVSSLIRDHESRLEGLRGTLDRYVERYTKATAESEPSSIVEVVAGWRAVMQRLWQIQYSAREEVLVFDKPPYAAPAHTQIDGAEREQLDRGVRVKVIYERQGLEVPDRLETLREFTDHGEEARVLDLLPTKMVITDRSVAVVPIGQGEAGLDGIVVVKAGALIDALVSLFESSWRLAVPASPTAGENERHTEGSDRELLTLVSIGMKDDAIAGQLGVSRRTVQRRIEVLRTSYGAHNRAHLITLASREGGTG